jgi:ABC-type proline/glycine betaine transport system permease subunit
MKPLEIAKYLTLFFIGFAIIITIVKLGENNLKLSTYEVIVLSLLFSIAIGIHYTILFLEEIDSTGIVNTLNDISTKGILGSLVK